MARVIGLRGRGPARQTVGAPGMSGRLGGSKPTIDREGSQSGLARVRGRFSIERTAVKPIVVNLA